MYVNTHNSFTLVALFNADLNKKMNQKVAINFILINNVHNKLKI